MSIYPDQKPNADIMKEQADVQIFQHIEALGKAVLYTLSHEEPRRAAYEKLVELWKKSEHEALAAISHNVLVQYWTRLKAEDRLPEHRGDAESPKGLF
jgi:putative heme degradation protein